MHKKYMVELENTMYSSIYIYSEKSMVGVGKNLLDGFGKFIDDVLEDSCQTYVKRKIKEGKTFRERLDWEKEIDFYKYESPIA